LKIYWRLYSSSYLLILFGFIGRFSSLTRTRSARDSFPPFYVFDFDFCDAAAAAFPSGFPVPPGLAFFGIKILAKFDPTVEKLIKFTLEKPRKIQNSLNIFVKK
jgi:hypothetical protein